MMKHIIEEQILVYEQEQLNQWKSGDKSLIPHFIDLHSDYKNQQSYHFGEIFVISAFHRLQGWKGFRFYALGTWEPNNQKYDRSREMIAKLFPARKLAEFREARREQDRTSGKGEPDVMLYNDNGQSLFLEVKKGSDKIFDAQLTCLAQIKSILGAEIGIIYVREESQKYTPKKYELDLLNHSGRAI
jgi:hypothetical protein